MSTQKILHFGLNRSGTNYLKELLDQHFDLEFINVEGERTHPLHKHFRIYNDKTLIGRPRFRNNLAFASFSEFEAKVFGNDTDISKEGGKTATGDRPVVYLIISKDPYSWHLSYSRWGIKNGWSASPHPYILEYNAFYSKWLEFADETNRITFIRYIDLLKRPDEILKELQQKYGFSNTRQIDPDVRIRKVPMSGRFSRKRLNYYLEEAYLDEYSAVELAKLNKNIDHALARKLGYTIHHRGSG